MLSLLKYISVMHLTNQVTPSKEEFVDFIKSYPSNKEIVMINILKFRNKSGLGEETGQQAYMRYSKNMTSLVSNAGGKVLWGGRVNRTVIGDYKSQPDMVIIVTYPNKESFINMSTTPEYEEISKDRKIALEYGGLLAAQTINGM